MEYITLCPKAEVDPIENVGLRPRIEKLENITIGLFASFKEHWVLILDEIGRQLKAKYPTIKLTHFQYTKDLNSYTTVAEIEKDNEVRPAFEKWLRGVDTVLVANGDAGSCALYLTYNASAVERLGKPVVMMLNNRFIRISKSAAALRGVPNLRFVEIDIPELAKEIMFNEYVKKLIQSRVEAVLDKIINALTSPLSESEKDRSIVKFEPSNLSSRGNIQEINKIFYEKSWSYGMPIIPPTEGAVKEMLNGTDLPSDHVVARIPPMHGKATIEKIAINAVMAGCAPTHMPVLIAAVEALVDKKMWIEAYTCSIASWAPLVIINGPIRQDINVNSGVTLMSPYFRANAAIAHAVGLILMNIAGVRAGIEDMGIFGHEGRFGICIAENEEESPWESLHEHQGLEKNDSAVTIFWPNTRSIGTYSKNVEFLLKSICDNVQAFGFDPGCAIIMCPETAKLLYQHGYSRKDVMSYIVEYARRPASEINIRWMIGNNHMPKNVRLPAESTRSVRKFFSDRHLPIIVAGMSYAHGVALYGGGGDHGGPVTKKIVLPKNWKKLKEEFKDNKQV